MIINAKKREVFQINKAQEGINNADADDFIIINEDIEVSVGRVQSILMAERLRRQRQVGLSDFVKRLQEGY